MAILLFNMSWAAEGSENMAEAFELCEQAINIMDKYD